MKFRIKSTEICLIIFIVITILYFINSNIFNIREGATQADKDRVCKGITNERKCRKSKNCRYNLMAAGTVGDEKCREKNFVKTTQATTSDTDWCKAITNKNTCVSSSRCGWDDISDPVPNPQCIPYKERKVLAVAKKNKGQDNKCMNQTDEAKCRKSSKCRWDTAENVCRDKNVMKVKNKETQDDKCKKRTVEANCRKSSECRYNLMATGNVGDEKCRDKNIVKAVQASTDDSVWCATITDEKTCKKSSNCRYDIFTDSANPKCVTVAEAKEAAKLMALGQNTNTSDVDADLGSIDMTSDNTCDYLGQIKTPKQLKMSGKGNWDQIGKNMAGLNAYYDLTVTGDSKASTTGGPLGCKGFRLTGATCNLNGQEVNEYTYFNDVPGNPLPKTLRGLVPGMLSGVTNMASLASDLGKGGMGALSGLGSICKETTLPVQGMGSTTSTDTKAININELTDMSPCWFPGGVNTETGERCKQGFKNYKDFYQLDNKEDDTIVKLYMLALGLGGLYICYNLRKKMKLL